MDPVPQATRTWRTALGRAGLEVRQEAALTEGDVACTMWVCVHG